MFSIVSDLASKFYNNPGLVLSADIFFKDATDSIAIPKHPDYCDKILFQTRSSSTKQLHKNNDSLISEHRNGLDLSETFLNDCSNEIST